MASLIKRQLIVGSLMSALGLMGCVSQSKYDDLEAQNQQLQQQNAAMAQQDTDNALVGPALQREGITSNQILSQKRAENVMEFLISQGLNPSLVEAHGFGDAKSVASNKTPKGRAETRRVELTLAG